MGKKYPIKLLNGNIESTVGVVKKRLEVQEHTVKVMNALLLYLPYKSEGENLVHLIQCHCPSEYKG